MIVYLVVYHHETGSWGDTSSCNNEAVFTMKEAAQNYINDLLKDKNVEITYEPCCYSCEHPDNCDSECLVLERKVFNVEYRNDDNEPVDFDWYDIEELEIQK